MSFQYCGKYKNKRFYFAKPNQARRIIPGNRINNEWINLKLKRVAKIALSWVLYAATQTEIGTGLPKVVNEKHQNGKGDFTQVSKEDSKAFPDNSDGRGNEMPLYPAQSRKSELQSYRPQRFD